MSAGAAGSRADAAPPGRQEPLAWRTAAVAVLGLVAGALAASLSGLRIDRLANALQAHGAAGHDELSAQLVTVDRAFASALLTVFVLLAALDVRGGRDALLRSAASGLPAVAAMFVASLVSASPLASGVAMATVMAACVLATRQGAAVRATGLLLNLVYFYYAAFGVAGRLAFTALFEVAAIGFATALAVLLVVNLARRLLGSQEAQTETDAPPQAGSPELPRVAFFAGGPTMRYALGRGALLGALAGLYALRLTLSAPLQADHSVAFHDVFWVLLTCWVVLAPIPDATPGKALRRTAGVMIGCLLVAGLSELLPGSWIVALGAVSILVGILWIRRSYTVFQATVSFLIVAVLGGSHRSSVAAWAGRRIVDTLIGVVLALGVYAITVLIPARRSGRAAAD